MARKELLEEAMDAVDLLHRVVLVLGPLGHPSRYDGLRRSRRRNQRRMRLLAVVDYVRKPLDVGKIGIKRALFRRLPDASDDERRGLPVGRAVDAPLVPRKPLEPASVGFPNELRALLGDVGLVDPDEVVEDDGILASAEDDEDLLEPIKPGGARVSVVQGRGRHGMVLKQMDEVFRPFGERDLPRVEYGVRERVEPPAAPRVEALEGLDAVLSPAAFPYPGAAASRASLDGDGVDEAYLGRSGLRVLLDVPPDDVLLDEKPGRTAQKDGLGVDLVLFHASPFPRVRRRAPGSGETSDGIRLRTCSKSAWFGSEHIINGGFPLFKNHACALFAFKLIMHKMLH